MTRPIASTIRYPLRVVAIGGGTGLPTVLRGMKVALFPEGTDDPDRLVAIVTVTDDGGSSGRLREELGVLPPGDVRNCMVALSHNEPLMSRVFQARYTSRGDLDGHAVGNLILAALAQLEGGCFLSAVQEASEVLNIQGRVLPSTLEPTKLVARLACGADVIGESTIYETDASGSVEKLRLEPNSPAATRGVVDSILEADIVVLGPGSLFTSILTNVLIPDVAEALRETSAFRLMVVNAMTEPGETAGFGAVAHVEALDKHVGDAVLDGVLMASDEIPQETIDRYREEDAIPIDPFEAGLESRVPMVFRGELLEFTPKVRHVPERLASEILAAYSAWAEAGFPRMRDRQQSSQPGRTAEMSE